MTSQTHTDDSCLSWLSCDPAAKWPLDTKHSQTRRKHSWLTQGTTWGLPLCRKKKKSQSCAAWGSHLKLLVLLRLGAFSAHYGMIQKFPTVMTFWPYPDTRLKLMLAWNQICSNQQNMQFFFCYIIILFVWFVLKAYPYSTDFIFISFPSMCFALSLLSGS